jgi:hypothetical protein
MLVAACEPHCCADIADVASNRKLESVRQGTKRIRLAILVAACVSASASASDLWMDEAAMRSEFIGKTLDGHYGNGTRWTERYQADGRLEYWEKDRRAVGNWSFHGPVFCTFYDKAFMSSFFGGCWIVHRAGPNCFEFYAAPGSGTDLPGERQAQWNARGWRNDVPATCKESPSV